MLERVKVNKKLLGGFLILSCLTLIMGISSLVNSKKIHSISDNIHKSIALPLENIAQMNETYHRVRVNMRDHIRVKTHEQEILQSSTIEKLLTEFEQNYKEFTETELDAKTVQYSKDLKIAYDDFKVMLNEVLQLSSQGQDSIAQEMVNQNYNTELKVQKILEDIMEHERAQSEKTIANSEKSYNLILFSTIAFIIVAIGLGLVLGLILTKNITDPLSKIIDMIKELGKGNLNARTNIKRQDEIGFLANALDEFAVGQQTVIKQIQESALTISSASEELSAVSRQLATASEETNRQANSVASTTEEMTTNINTMASAAEEMSVNVNSIASGAEQMSVNMTAVSSNVNEMSGAISEIGKSAKDATSISQNAISMSTNAGNTMDNLGNAAKEIGKVTDVIKRIAEQTNLLALNATIEAASAGDAGKGFAVVANEIKELANQSAQAAGDIASRVEGIQNNTGEAIKVIRQITDIINKVGESIYIITTSVEQQTKSSNEISSNVSQASSGVQNIATAIGEVAKGAADMSKNAGEAAKGSQDVALNISNVRKASIESNNGAQQVYSSAQELAKISVSLQKMVENFKV